MKETNKFPKTKNRKPTKLSTKTNPGNSLRSESFINRVANTLVCLSKGKNAVTEIADDCKLSASTAHRLLNVLAEPGFTIYDPISHLYYLGPLISQLTANPSITYQFLIRAATDEMKRLSGITEETLILSVLIGIQPLSLISIPSKQSLRVHETDENDKKARSLAPLGAGQKVMLSQVDDVKLNLVLKSIKILDDPLIDIEQMKRELKKTNEKGYAISEDVRIPGVMGISAPVKNYTAPLALTILGPTNRLKTQVSGLTAELLGSTNRLSNNIQEFFK
jgi:DNA-binding IclR family transcriptional regulator